MRVHIAVVVTVTAALLAACNGKGVAPLPATGAAPAGAAAVRTSRGGTTLTITLPPIQPPHQPYPWTTPYPARLSPATASISGAIGNLKFGPIALGSGTPACPNAAPNLPLKCSFTVGAPIGSGLQFTLATHAAPGVSALPLATASQRVRVFAGKNYLAASPLGIAQKIATRLATSNLRAGRYANVPIVVYGIDAAGKAIPGQIANSAEINVRLKGFVNATFTENCTLGDCQPIYCCGVISTFVYDGIATGRESIRTTSTISYNPVTTSVTVKPENEQLATLLLGIASNAGPNVNALFAANAAGNVAPVRAVQAAGPLFGEDAQGNYWAGSTHYSNRNKVLRSVDLGPQAEPVAVDSQGHIYAVSSAACGFWEYPANSYGRLKPIRRVRCSGALEALGVDDAGNVYVTLGIGDISAVATIVEYAPATSSGKVPPIRTISMSLTPYGTFNQLGFDGSGNVYALAYSGDSGDERLYEFAPGATTGEQILASVPIDAFTVDGAGDIYAAVQKVRGGPFAIEEFPSGSTTPSRIVAGSRTGLANGVYDVDPILVPR